MPNKTIQCEVRVFDNVSYWYPEGKTQPIARKEGDTVERLGNPPFYQILPCPYCGVKDDREHNVEWAGRIDGHVLQKR